VSYAPKVPDDFSKFHRRLAEQNSRKERLVRIARAMSEAHELLEQAVQGILTPEAAAEYLSTHADQAECCVAVEIREAGK